MSSGGSGVVASQLSMPTIKDVARVAGVSFKTVSRVINNDAHVRDALRQRVFHAMEELNYKQNLSARFLRTQESRTIGLITDRIVTTPYSGNIIKGAQEEAWHHGMMLLIVNTEGDAKVEQRAVEMMLNRQIDGLAYAAVHHREIAADTLKLLPTNIPSVLIDCFSGEQIFPTFLPNEQQAGHTATEFLIKKHHQRIAFINGRPDFPAAVGRHCGYARALEEHGLTYDERLVADGGWWQQDGYVNTLKLMRGRLKPSAIFCASDRIAMGAYAALTELGLRIPEDVAIVGFDNNEVIAAHLRPPLTTMELPYYAMGKAAIKHLVANDASDGLPYSLELFECPIIVRASA
jgi:LacI family transcriptional regulator